MSKAQHEKLVIAISSRALFSLDESHTIFEKDGIEAYCRYQIENEDTHPHIWYKMNVRIQPV